MAELTFKVGRAQSRTRVVSIHVWMFVSWVEVPLWSALIWSERQGVPSVVRSS